MKRYARLAAALLLVSTAVFAQSTYGTIYGSVIDPSGGIIRDAVVEAKNPSTGSVRSTKTSSDGLFRFVNLDAGSYIITVSASGFATEEKKDLVLRAREDVPADFQLQVAGASTTVDVGAVQEVTEQLTLSDSKTGDTLNSLALNFRATNNPSPIVAAALAPGTNIDSGGNITISGQLPTATSFSLDGISTQLPRQGGPSTNLFPSVEGIAEFQVNTAANSAEYSQPTDLTVISRSGTNDFHGGAFWYFQREDFNAQDQIAGNIPTGDANDFGVSFGGPVVIPHVYNGKNRTFFYFDYEGIRLSQNGLIDTFTPPSQWRTGDFSATGVTIIDPTTRTPFANNMVPLTSINPVSAKILPLFFPNPTSSAAALSTPNLVQPFPGTYNNDGFDGRLDQVITQNQHVWGRVTQKTITNSGNSAALGALGLTGAASYNPLMGSFASTIDATNLAASYNWIIRPTLINEFRVGFSRYNPAETYPQAAQGDSIISSLGITGLPGSPKNGLGGVPVFYIGDFLGGATNQFGHPRIDTNFTFELGDNVSWVKGAHSLKFGFEFIRRSYEDQITFLSGDEYGDYFFTGAFTAAPRVTPGDVNGFSDFLLGITSDAYQAQNGPDGKPYAYHYGGYAQDEWRLNPNLTLTYGLRYEVNPPFNDETHQLGNFDRNFPGGRLVVQQEGLSLINPLWRAAVGNTPFVSNTQVGLPDSLRYTYWDNIQPRLGIAWSPGKKHDTVIRAAGGIYSVPVLGAVLYSLLGVDTSYFAEYPSSATNPRTFQDVFAGGAAGVSYPSYRRANQYDLKDPRVIQWTLSVDHNLGWNTLVRASYTGSHTYNLIDSPDLNQVAPNTYGYAALTATPALRQQNLKYPNFSEVLTRDNGEMDKYDALSLELNKRFSNGLTFSNNYTFAKNITNALGTAPSGAVPVGGQIDNGNNVQDIYNLAQDSGNAYFTPRHRFVSTLVYNLPFGRGQKFAGNVSRVENLFIGGWALTGVTLLQTGPWLTPYFPTSTADPSGTNPTQRSVGQQRPDCVSGKTGYLSNPTSSTYFDSTAFTIPASNIGRYGNCGVGILEGPGTSTFSMSAGKIFQITERVRVRYEAQFANLFNILNEAPPNMNVGASNFGQITASQPVGLGQQAGPRTIQMMLRFQF
ncbi:MAG TPA: TonB-dependent receptor [Bryobacteraceae bacterium]|nr:TonB-dependent receptor [Bryobacteraceae bacterium]